MKKFLGEFKAFAMRGNVIDMAVGVVVGGAFSKIVSSLVADIITPLISLLIGGADFKALNVILRPEVIDELGEVVEPALTWNYGVFIQAIIDFIIIAFCIFVVVKMINNLKDGSKKMKKKKKGEEEPAPVEAPKEPEPTKEELLLTEIRDLLKEKK